MKMVFDCMPFLNENDLFEIRLKTHWNFVDKFIIVEAGETHTGNKKSFNFDIERFKEYSDKIIYVTFDNFQDEINKYPELLDDLCLRDRGECFHRDDWIRNHFQSNYLYKILTDVGANDTDIVNISCLDEIIRPESFSEALKRFDGNELYNGFRPMFGFHLNCYTFKINLLHKHWKNHITGYVTEFSNFKKILPTSIRDLAELGFKTFPTHPPIENAGYTFSFLDDTDGEKVLTKAKSWAHSRDRVPWDEYKYGLTDKKDAVRWMFWTFKPTIVPITEETHPKYMIENLGKYQKYIYNGDIPK